MADFPEQRVVYIVEGRSARPTIREAYPTKIVTILGVLQLVCGALTFGLELLGLQLGATSLGTGLWVSLFFCVSGGLTVAGARAGTKCLVVATMVMTIISAITTVILLLMSGIVMVLDNSHGDHYYSSYDYDYDYYTENLTAPAHSRADQDAHLASLDQAQRHSTAIYSLLLLTGVVMMIVSILTSALTCRATCCRPSSPGAVLYSPRTDAPPPPGVGEVPLPDFSVGAEETGKYQQF